MKKIKLIISFIIILLFGGNFLFAQSKSVQIYLKDICNQKDVSKAKVTLEGYKKEPIVAKYNKEEHYYYFENTPNDYTTIFAAQNNYETVGFLKNGDFPSKINLQLNCKGNIRETMTKERVYSENKNGMNFAKYVTDTIFTGRILVRDNYKIKISLKKSYNLSYNEVKRKIDSIVVPYGLEYIDNLVPEMFFAHFNGPMIGTESQQSFSTKLDKTKSISDLLTDEKSILGKFNRFGDFVKDSPYSFWDDYYFQLIYRKKDKTTFNGDFDLLLSQISKENSSLTLELLYYTKFFINPDYPLKISCKNLSKYDDKIMNYQFFNQYDNDATRVLFMDKYFENGDTFLGKYELDTAIHGDVVYYPEPYKDRSNFNYKLELSKK